jgi:hypothetical protein
MIDRSFNALRNRRNCSLATIDHHDVSRRLEVWQCRFDDRFEAHCGPAALGASYLIKQGQLSNERCGTVWRSGHEGTYDISLPASFVDPVPPFFA